MKDSEVQSIPVGASLRGVFKVAVVKESLIEAASRACVELRLCSALNPTIICLISKLSLPLSIHDVMANVQSVVALSFNTRIRLSASLVLVFLFFFYIFYCFLLDSNFYWKYMG